MNHFIFPKNGSIEKSQRSVESGAGALPGLHSFIGYPVAAAHPILGIRGSSARKDDMSQAQEQAVVKDQAPKVEAAELIAAHFARTTYADLPAPVISAVKISILDMLGCIRAGTSES